MRHREKMKVTQRKKDTEKERGQRKLKRQKDGKRYRERQTIERKILLLFLISGINQYFDYAFLIENARGM